MRLRKISRQPPVLHWPSVFFVSYVSDEYTITEAPGEGLASKRVSIVRSTTPQFKLNSNKFTWEYYQR